MKAWLLVVALAFSASGVSAADSGEASLLTDLERSGANYCYRVSSWHENPDVPRFVVTFFFFYDPKGRDGALTVYDGGIPFPIKATVTIETNTRGKGKTHSVHLDAQAANEMVCRFGYSGFFASDSNDAVQKYFDGHGLTAERLFAGKYDMKTRSYKESLSCKWLYDFLAEFTKRHEQ